MLKYLLLSLIVISSAGCSITPDYYDYQAPYCYTDETTKIVDGQTVDSEVQLECTDRPGKQMEIASETQEEFSFGNSRGEIVALYKPTVHYSDPA